MQVSSLIPRSVLPAVVLALAGAAIAGAAQPHAQFTHGAWPFHPPLRRPIPAVQRSDWMLNPIDAFVLEQLEAQGLSPSKQADRLTLLRRVTFDLTGLPPTRDEQEAFLADESPGAYLKVVDRLLASPRYGERWAQHWLDTVRYAETEGFKSDRLRPNAHRYRDYVIRSLDADRPYDDFVRQQIAGDQLDPDNPDAVIATGVHRLYPDEDNAQNYFQRRQEILNDVTETTGLAFMGLTMGCAQCHDHKFDDILQADFYRLQAFFAPMVEDNPPAVPPAEREIHRRQYDAWEQATAELRREMDALIAEEKQRIDHDNLQKFRPEIQDCYLLPEAERTPLQQQIALMVQSQLQWRFKPKDAVKKLPKEQQERYAALENALEQFGPLKPEPLPVAMAIADIGQEAPPTYLLAGGSWRKPQDQIEPGFPVFLISTEVETSPPERPRRRADLARWLTRDDHPLTSRVIVNRLWQHHFGRGLVATPNDFGAMGDPPTHPELLDWLAVELVEHGWSLKHIHRLMVTSATYCQSSRLNPENPAHAKAVQLDANNTFLWRARRRRLEGEAIRDAVLKTAGVLNEQMFGPSAQPPLPVGISERYAWKADEDEASHDRRSIYVLAKRNMRFPLFDVFDLPDMHSSCGRRTTTTNAPQALLMLNGELTLDLARRWAEELHARTGDDLTGLVADAYATAFARRPELAELSSARQFLLAQSALTEPEASDALAKAVHGDTAVPISTEAVADFCHALMNSNEFIYLD